MEKTSGINLISAFLDENGYKLLHPLLAKQRALDPGEYTWWDSTHIRLFTLHRKYKMTLKIVDTILSIHMDLQSNPNTNTSYSQRTIGPPLYQDIDLAKPRALEQFESLI